MNFPFRISFKLFAFAPQMRVTDRDKNLIFYVKQKLFKLKESVTVYADETQTKELYKINADRILDFTANYYFSKVNGEKIGSVRRSGMKSIWKAHYTILDQSDETIMTIREENPWIKVLDALVGEIPFIGILMGYLLHPSYIVTLEDGSKIFRLKKKASFLERAFEIEKISDYDKNEEILLLGLMMLTLLERARG
ncbi:MAG TPA: hypothetical protein PK079_09800 [Leptospiraceae bacterium]|nr:hypothetical protein [Leptospiraceae bacterium]HMW06961.1 hypothetical protein [Leptospiraceae bacterium]HMX35433.1 hypothetical protein [Leptospiraceae bacterium]HMY30571.1 hypothetical protein [Leptospiraceae bacterium]HMZ65502.1 hypothetical protein [Leptospiraceae bacterium]